MLTKLQADMLQKIALDEFQPGNGADPETFEETGQTWAEMIIETKQDQGVFVSLTNAGLVGHTGFINAGRVEGRIKNDAGCWLTEEGFKAYKAHDYSKSE